jgi:hypothetical protein
VVLNQWGGSDDPAYPEDLYPQLADDYAITDDGDEDAEADLEDDLERQRRILRGG